MASQKWNEIDILKDGISDTSTIAITERCLAKGIRTDGRGCRRYRPVNIDVSLDLRQTTISFGNTIVLCSVTSEVVEHVEREDLVHFSVEISPFNSALYEPGKATDREKVLARAVEGVFRAGAIEQESLVVVANERSELAWSVRIDLRVLQDDGGLADACAFAALAGLLVHRRQEAIVRGEEIELVEDPLAGVPFDICVRPILVTLWMLPDAEGFLVDPTRVEEALLETRSLVFAAVIWGSLQLTLLFTPWGDLLSLRKLGGKEVNQELIDKAISIGREIAARLHKRLDEAIAREFEERNELRRFVNSSYGSESRTK